MHTVATGARSHTTPAPGNPSNTTLWPANPPQTLQDTVATACRHHIHVLPLHAYVSSCRLAGRWQSRPSLPTCSEGLWCAHVGGKAFAPLHQPQTHASNSHITTVPQHCRSTSPAMHHPHRMDTASVCRSTQKEHAPRRLLPQYIHRTTALLMPTQTHGKKKTN